MKKSALLLIVLVLSSMAYSFASKPNRDAFIVWEPDGHWHVNCETPGTKCSV